jgi:hypothetical protein
MDLVDELKWWEPRKEKKYDLPVDYDKLEWQERRTVREQYVKEQQNMCYYCDERLDQDAPEYITDKKINWDLFPPKFLKHPIHLQHCHNSGMTEGAVHSYCNAVMWQYEGR